MKKITLSAVAAILLIASAAYGQATVPTEVVQANRVVVRVPADQWKDVSVRAYNVAFENGEMRLSGNVRISVGSHVMTADAAVLRSSLVTLEGNARVESVAK